MEEPSNPMPPPRASGSSSAVMAKLFKIPRISVNHSLMNFTFTTLSIYSFASLALGIFMSPFLTIFWYYSNPLLQEYYKGRIFLKVDILAHGVIAFDSSPGRGKLMSGAHSMPITLNPVGQSQGQAPAGG